MGRPYLKVGKPSLSPIIPPTDQQNFSNQRTCPKTSPSDNDSLCSILIRSRQNYSGLKWVVFRKGRFVHYWYLEETGNGVRLRNVPRQHSTWRSRVRKKFRATSQTTIFPVNLWISKEAGLSFYDLPHGKPLTRLEPVYDVNTGERLQSVWTDDLFRRVHVKYWCDGRRRKVSCPVLNSCPTRRTRDRVVPRTWTRVSTYSPTV